MIAHDYARPPRRENLRDRPAWLHQLIAFGALSQVPDWLTHGAHCISSAVASRHCRYVAAGEGGHGLPLLSLGRAEGAV
jgi:hypothetical protein